MKSPKPQKCDVWPFLAVLGIFLSVQPFARLSQTSFGGPPGKGVHILTDLQKPIKKNVLTGCTVGLVKAACPSPDGNLACPTKESGDWFSLTKISWKSNLLQSAIIMLSSLQKKIIQGFGSCSEVFQADYSGVYSIMPVSFCWMWLTESLWQYQDAEKNLSRRKSFSFAESLPHRPSQEPHRFAHCVWFQMVCFWTSASLKSNVLESFELVLFSFCLVHTWRASSFPKTILSVLPSAGNQTSALGQLAQKLGASPFRFRFSVPVFRFISS